MEPLFKKNLDVLLDDDANLDEKKKASDFFLKLAKDGIDIGAAIPALIELYRDCHQVPVMEPAADAFMLHSLHEKHYDAINEFLENDEYKMFAFESVQRIAEQGADIEPLLPMLLQHFPANQNSLYYTVKAFIKQGKGKTASTRLRLIADLMRNNDAIRPFLAHIVQEGAIDHMDMSSALDGLVTLLSAKEDRIREQAITAMSWAVDGKTDFSSIVDALESALGKVQGHDEGLAYIIGYHYAVKQKWDKLTRLLSATDMETRFGGLHAVIVHLNDVNKTNPSVLSFSLDALSDAADKVRELAFNGIIEADRKKVQIIPEPDRLKEIAEKFHSKSETTELYKYLYHVSAKDRETAQLINDTLKKAARKPGKMAILLIERLDELLAGKHSPVCSICRNIPRSKIYNSEYDLPKEVKKFQLQTPSLGSETTIPKCPECGALYYYNFEQEYDDMSLDTTIVLKRLDPIEALQYLKDKEKESYENSLPDKIMAYWNDLKHPVEYAREEAAWALTRYAIAKHRWDDIAKMLGFADPTVRREIMQELSAAGANAIAMKDLSPLLKAAIEDPDLLTRYHAALILAQDSIHTGDHEALERLINHRDKDVVSAATYQIWMAVRNEKLDISPFYAKLVALTRSKTETIRNHTRYALEESTKSTKGTSKKSVMDIFIKNLSDADPDVRNDAASSLGNIAEDERKDISKAIPKLADLLGNKDTAWQAINTLKKAASWTKLKILEAVPALVSALKSSDINIQENAAEVLYQAMKNGADISAAYPLLGNHLGKTGNLQSIAVEIFNAALEKGNDISIIEPSLRSLMTGRLDDYNGDFIVKVLTTIYLKAKDWKKLEQLLGHENKHVPGKVASRLEEENKDITPLVPALVKNLGHGYWYVRDRAAAALSHFSKSNGANHDLVKLHVGNIKVKNDQKVEELNRLIKDLDAIPVEKPVVKKAPFQQAYDDIIAKKLYLRNFSKAQTVRGNNEPRFIFFNNDRVYDVWFNIDTQEITDISWCNKDEFLELLPIAFSPGNITTFLSPYTKIPQEVLDKAPKIGDAVEQVLVALANPATWFHLRSTLTTRSRWFLRDDKAWGLHVISVDGNDKIKGISLRRRNQAIQEIIKAMYDFPGETPEPANTQVIAKAAEMWEILDATLARLDAGEILVEYLNDYYQRYFIKNGDLYFYIFADGGEVDSVSERTRESIINEMLEKVSDDKQPTFAEIKKSLKKEIFRQTDVTKYAELLKDGELHIGGGPTTDMQWIIRCEGGQFVRTQGDGYGGVNSQILSEDQVKQILKDKRYGWVKFDQPVKESK
nr:hypothetical protein [Candidatus Sigynarchaeota archaeon]